MDADRGAAEWRDARDIATMPKGEREHEGWKLEQHKLTTHCRILTPERKCVAWGGKSEMVAAFEKVQLQMN